MVWHVLKRRVRHDMSLAGVWYVQVPRESEICVTCSGNLRVWHVCDMSRCPESDMCLICSGRVWRVFDVFRYSKSLTSLWHFEAESDTSRHFQQKKLRAFDILDRIWYVLLFSILCDRSYTQGVWHVCDRTLIGTRSRDRNQIFGQKRVVLCLTKNLYWFLNF
jgi:hypothetical protein